MNENINSSNTQHDINKQLVSYNEKQNDLIFKTRERLFDLEKIQKRDVFILLGINVLICTLCILLAIKSGGFTW